MTKRLDLVGWLVGWYSFNLYGCFDISMALFETLNWRRRRRSKKQKQWKQFHKICILHSMHHFDMGNIYLWSSHTYARIIFSGITGNRNECHFQRDENLMYELKCCCFFFCWNKCFSIVYTFGTRAKIKFHHILHID